MGCRGDLDVRRVAVLLTGYDLWMAILVIAFCIQVVPVLLVVMMFSLGGPGERVDSRVPVLAGSGRSGADPVGGSGSSQFRG